MISIMYLLPRMLRPQPAQSPRTSPAGLASRQRPGLGKQLGADERAILTQPAVGFGIPGGGNPGRALKLLERPPTHRDLGEDSSDGHLQQVATAWMRPFLFTAGR